MVERNILKEIKRDASLHDTYMLDVLNTTPDGPKRRYSRKQSKVLDEKTMQKILKELKDLCRFIVPENDMSSTKK